MDLKQAVLHKTRHGLLATTVHYGFVALRKVTPCEILRVFVADGTPVGDGQVSGYVTRELTLEEAHGHSITLPRTPDFAAAIKRGDRCFVNIFERRVVGHTFTSPQAIPIHPGLSLGIPPEFDYSYGSYTAPEHRGKRLTLARSDSRKIANQKNGLHRPLAWYVAVDNYGSLAALARIVGARVVGHLAYIGIGNRYLARSSTACQNLGFSLKT